MFSRLYYQRQVNNNAYNILLLAYNKKSDACKILTYLKHQLVITIIKNAFNTPHIS